MFKTKKRTSGGFTLIEMLIVVVIVGVLVAVAVPRFVGIAREARTSQCAANIRAIDSAIELYHLRTGAYPDALSDVTGDTTYFPDSAPTCPFDVDYDEITQDGKVIGCDRTGHFSTGDWPHTHGSGDGDGDGDGGDGDGGDTD